MNKKRLVALVASVVMAVSVFAGCGKTESGNTTKTKVGMVTDSGTIDDKSFNQGTWEGIKKYEADKKNTEIKYLQPSGELKTNYLNAIKDLTDTGYKIIVTPGYKFELAVDEAADKYKDVTFILIDGTTHKDGSFDFVKHDNVASILFNEHEAGFLAGVAAALSTKTNKLGFVGGMEIPPVQKYGWGYKAGVSYASKTFGTKAEVTDYIYQGTFNDVAAGQNLAAGMYNKGVDIIFHAAGGVGAGVFAEAKQRAEKGGNVFVVGVDVDQYETGKLTNGKSVTLTSAMKRLGLKASENIDDKINNKFKGGNVTIYSLADNGVGLPEKNPNLSDAIMTKINQVKKDIVDKKVVVPSTKEALDKFLK